MPTKNPRLFVTLDPVLFEWVKSIAEAQKVSMSLAMRDIVKEKFREEGWFWAKNWQSGEKEADEDLKKKRYKDFESLEDLLRDLKQ